MINWKVRIKNKWFWLALIPGILALIAKILELFGIHFEYGTIEAQICSIVESIFGLLTIFGVVNDPTTEGLGDSTQALTYEEPKRKA